MRVTLINGSPKRQGSSSGKLIKALRSFLKKERSIIVQEISAQKEEEALAQIKQQDCLVFIFPLYVDGIPAHLVQFLDRIIREESGMEAVKIYAVVNCGFFEGKQAQWALQLMKNWCGKAGYTWCGGLGIGGGGMIPMMGDLSAGKGPGKPLATELSQLARCIRKGVDLKSDFISPAFPRRLYILAAQIGWRQQIRRNGLKVRDLGKRIL